VRGCRLDWAASIGDRGFALLVIADRTDDLSIAQKALEQLDVAIKTFNDAGHVPHAAALEKLRPQALALRERMKTGYALIG
jgi:hypothetical protein